MFKNYIKIIKTIPFSITAHIFKFECFSRSTGDQLSVSRSSSRVNNAFAATEFLATSDRMSPELAAKLQVCSNF